MQAGTDLLRVPSSALLTANTIPKDFRSYHPKITVHGLLASFLAFGGESTTEFAPWTSTWPSLDDFRDSMPLLWCRDLEVRLGRNKPANVEFEMGVFSVLPPAIKGFWLQTSTSQFYEKTGFVHIQEKRLQADWEVVVRIFPDASFERYLYFWLAVNSRSLYYESPGVVVHPPREDRMTLCPFVDLFNHSDAGVRTQGPSLFGAR